MFDSIVEAVEKAKKLNTHECWFTLKYNEFKGPMMSSLMEPGEMQKKIADYMELNNCTYNVVMDPVTMDVKVYVKYICSKYIQFTATMKVECNEDWNPETFSDVEESDYDNVGRPINHLIDAGWRISNTKIFEE